MDFAKRLKLARKKAGLTQAAVASSAGLSQSAYAKYETGRRMPKNKERIARALNTSAAWLDYGIEQDAA
jgi:transcriptional regulator with XRE-family HTH domain